MTNFNNDVCELNMDELELASGGNGVSFTLFGRFIHIGVDQTTHARPADPRGPCHRAGRSELRRVGDTAAGKLEQIVVQRPPTGSERRKPRNPVGSSPRPTSRRFTASRPSSAASSLAWSPTSKPIPTTAIWRL